MSLQLVFYVLMVLLTFCAIIKYEQKTTGFHRNGGIIMFAIIFSTFWFVYIPIFVVFLIFEGIVKLITGGK